MTQLQPSCVYKEHIVGLHILRAGCRGEEVLVDGYLPQQPWAIGPFVDGLPGVKKDGGFSISMLDDWREVTFGQRPTRQSRCTIPPQLIGLTHGMHSSFGTYVSENAHICRYSFDVLLGPYMITDKSGMMHRSRVHFHGHSKSLLTSPTTKPNPNFQPQPCNTKERWWQYMAADSNCLSW